jgi:hypothetical protein
MGSTTMSASAITRTSSYPTPGHRIVAQLGGLRATAALLGRHRTQVARWLKPTADGGRGGRIPQAVQDILVARAGLTLADFLPRDGEAFR